MKLLLDKQINVFALDTSDFYSNREKRLHSVNHRIRSERNRLINGGKVGKRNIIGIKELEGKLGEYGIEKEALKCIADGDYDFSVHGDNADAVRSICEDYLRKKKIIAQKNKKAKETKDALLKLLENKVDSNISSHSKHHIRQLREDAVYDNKIISVFDSYFTRTIGAKPNEFSDDFMIVKVFYFSVLKDLIYNGFMYRGKKYIYFTSSAGQIRTKKCVFVKESMWKKYEKSIMCGLTLDDINAKGGNNPNKHLAYLALANSATDVWKEFDIDKTIVVDDFETEVYGIFDFVSDIDYTITREHGHKPIAHTDGAGMMLPNAFGVPQKNMMVRLPWIKGLLGVFDYRKFIERYKCSPVIKDIYGVEHDVITEDIQVIFTKSQFKLWSFYDNWNCYKEKYKKYNCAAGITNIEEDRIKDATINYQMLQSLTDITNEEIEKIIKPSVDKLNKICGNTLADLNKKDKDKEIKKILRNIKDVFGATPYNMSKTAFQKCIELYPNLLNDEYAKSHLRRIKDSIVKKCKAGKLDVHGKYTFILPDFYAACEYWFLHTPEPHGLLNDDEVFCWLFRKNKELDCLRSPHLMLEHFVSPNVACYEYGDRMERLREWFCTDALYTSCHSFISRVLQFDVDGDKSLVVADKTIIDVAKRNIEKFDIVPLYYDMKKAEPVILNNESIYHGLNAAFVGGNIGIYSNNISKIWNSDVFVNGTEEEKIEAIDLIKILCMENNFVID